MNGANGAVDRAGDNSCWDCITTKVGKFPVAKLLFAIGALTLLGLAISGSIGLEHPNSLIGIKWAQAWADIGISSLSAKIAFISIWYFLGIVTTILGIAHKTKPSCSEGFIECCNNRNR